MGGFAQAFQAAQTHTHTHAQKTHTHMRNPYTRTLEMINRAGEHVIQPQWNLANLVQADTRGGQNHLQVTFECALSHEGERPFTHDRRTRYGTNRDSHKTHTHKNTHAHILND